MPQTSCDVHRYSDADFVGEVLSRRVALSDGKRAWYGVVFEIRGIESFRGTEKGGEVVSVRTSFGGGDCGYHQDE